MRFPLLRLLLSAPKTLGAERLLITLVKSSAAPLLRRFLGVALANFEITGQHLPESLEQRSSGQFPENKSIPWLLHIPVEQTGAVATGE
jgi:hypothetical protein